MTNTTGSLTAYLFRRMGSFLKTIFSLGLLILAVSLALTSAASAATPDFLLRIPDAEGKPGSGAGGLSNPRGIAANPETGHLYVSDSNNARIDEFTAWGLFVKAWGWDVAPEGAPGDTASDQLETCTTECQAGVLGNGPGQINGPRGIALDLAGDVYLYEAPLDETSRRVQKFNPAGEFLLMFGGEVNKTTKANVCTKADLEGGDECGAGITGTDPGQFSSGSVGNYLTYNPATETIFVGDKGRIQEFNLDGTFKSQIAFEGDLGALEGRTVHALASDPNTGEIYFALESNPPTIEKVFRLDPATQKVTDTLEVPYPNAIATDAAGNAYVVLKRYGDNNSNTLNTANEVLGFDANGQPITGMEIGEGFGKSPFDAGLDSLTGLGTNICAGSEAPGNLYATTFSSGQASYVDAYGSGPIGCEPPPLNSPEIESQYATSVDVDGAILEAQISPHFWSDTIYYVEYGTGTCAEGGCEAKQPVPSSLLTSNVTNEVLKSAGVFLAGLEPATEYHYRFVAQSSGGGPVYGADPDGAGPEEASFEAGVEGSLRTFALPGSPPACPGNADLRTGASAKLPDCRAYELVSPLDKENGDAGLLPPSKVSFEVNQSATSGERFTYSSISAFADPESAPYVSQYLSSRDPGAGWSTHSISPPRSSKALEGLRSLNNEFKAFSDDLCEAWLRHNSLSTLSEGAISGYSNLYRRQNCGAAPIYEALSTVKPLDTSATKYELTPMGASADGTRTIFLADGKLSPDAPVLKDDLGAKEVLLYIHSPEGLRYVCYLPNGKPNLTQCAAGTLEGAPDAYASAVKNAISRDGSRVFWSASSGTISPGSAVRSGRLYVREHPEQGKVAGECSEPEIACTIAVSESVSPDPALFWSATPDGSKAIFTIVAGALAGNLYEFDVESKTPHLIAKGVLGPMGVSEDASRIYFASTEDLDGGGPATVSDRNLYLYEAEGGGGSSFDFIMELPAADVRLQSGEGLSGVIDASPTERRATVSPDGTHAAFSSLASPTPTGYDNLDAASGEPDREVYLYDAAADHLRCVSCNPTRARPQGVDSGDLWVSARLPSSRTPLNAPRTLADDGSRLYFESHEALVPRDANGTWDVYQWEMVGKGSCSEADPTYHQDSGGCVDLISSGQSPFPSRFLDADISGNNVFIGTQSSLVPSDTGLSDVYVARVGGGLPEPPPPPAICEGEACQGQIPPPNDPTPASAAFQGAGNVAQGAKPRCQKPRVRRKGRCVTKAKNRKRAKHQRRAAR